MSGAAPGRAHRLRAASAAAVAAALLPAPALLALHFRDGPPARVTGGFGEDSCVACHSGHAVNDGVGQLTIAGLPERYESGATYELELALQRPGMAVAGFQLAVRNPADQTQAGTLELPAADAARLDLVTERGVQFAQHRDPRIAEPDAGIARWRIRWTAPETVERVVLHAAAVAGDGDESQTGDHVYTFIKGVRPL